MRTFEGSQIPHQKSAPPMPPVKSPKTDVYNDRFIEEWADYAHRAWAEWTNYMFQQCIIQLDGSLTVPPESYERWFQQIRTHYDDLSEEEKKSDREQARKIISWAKGLEQLIK